MSPKRDSDDEMSRFPFDDDTADRLLSGELAPGDAPPGYARLAEVVRAAQGPASRSELAMEASVVAAVGEAVRSIPGIRPSPNRRKSMLGKLASAKIAAIAATTVLGGAVAAAATGSLPAPAQHAASVALSQVGINVSDGSHGHGKGHTHGTAPGLVGNKHAEYGLCQAYEAHVSAGTLATGGWLNSTAFQTLATEATGGQAGLGAFCTNLLASAPTASNDAGESGADHGKPANPGKSHKPSSAGTKADDNGTTEPSEPSESDNGSVPAQGETHATAGAHNSSVGTGAASTATAGVTHSGRP
ncbi:MAG TPA: hypothetical protein VFA11_11710 [Acidimicrobiales bacterium]|nr:hypothetical protein [Acidimicrobiales bacterium]